MMTGISLHMQWPLTNNMNSLHTVGQANPSQAIELHRMYLLWNGTENSEPFSLARNTLPTLLTNTSYIYVKSV
jgi:hypothetical protein